MAKNPKLVKTLHLICAVLSVVNAVLRFGEGRYVNGFIWSAAAVCWCLAVYMDEKNKTKK